MQQDATTSQIIERIQACTDESLKDLILKLLVESGY